MLRFRLHVLSGDVGIFVMLCIVSKKINASFLNESPKNLALNNILSFIGTWGKNWLYEIPRN